MVYIEKFQNDESKRFVMLNNFKVHIASYTGYVTIQHIKYLNAYM